MKKSTKINIDKNRETVRNIEKERKQLIQFLLSDCELVEGSYIELLVRCGKAGCHCEKKPVHPITKLSWYEKGVLKNKIVRVADRKWVKKLSDLYKNHKKAISHLEKINETEKKALKPILKCKVKKYE